MKEILKTNIIKNLLILHLFQELNYLVNRPSIVDPITKELSVTNVKKILLNYLNLDEEKGFPRIYKWSQVSKINIKKFIVILANSFLNA